MLFDVISGQYLNKKMLDQEIKVGKAFKIDERIFYPLVKVFHYKHGQTESYSLSPIALVVVEGDMKYLLPFEEIESTEELLNMAYP